MGQRQLDGVLGFLSLKREGSQGPSLLEVSMQIEYVVTRHKREVSDAIGEALIARRIARRVETREMEAEEGEISSRTGKPKRRYKRRDMRAED